MTHTVAEKTLMNVIKPHIPYLGNVETVERCGLLTLKCGILGCYPAILRCFF